MKRYTEKYVRSLRKKIGRLQAIVDKVPRSGDGVPILPGDLVWVKRYENYEDGVWKWCRVALYSVGADYNSSSVEQLREDGDEIWGVDLVDMFVRRPEDL